MCWFSPKHRPCLVWAIWSRQPWAQWRHLLRAVSFVAPNRLAESPRGVRRVSSSNWQRAGGRHHRESLAVVVCDQPRHPRSAEQRCVHAKSQKRGPGLHNVTQYVQLPTAEQRCQLLTPNRKARTRCKNGAISRRAAAISITLSNLNSASICQQNKWNQNTA